MPRLTRLDAPGILHHVIIRGIERKRIFRDTADKENLVDRLSELIPKTQTRSDARGLFCHWCTSELGLTQSELAWELGMTVSGIGYAVRRGEAIAAREQCIEEIISGHEKVAGVGNKIFSLVRIR